MAKWCCHNNLDFNTTKTKEMITDVRRPRWMEYSALFHGGKEVKRVGKFKLCVVYIKADLMGSINISHQVKTKRRQYFLKKLTHSNIPQ